MSPVEMECVDLAPAVAQQLVGADRARHDLVEVFRVVALGEQLLALDEDRAQPGDLWFIRGIAAAPFMTMAAAVGRRETALAV